jgi:hypothetical protein
MKLREREFDDLRSLSLLSISEKSFLNGFIDNSTVKIIRKWIFPIFQIAGALIFARFISDKSDKSASFFHRTHVKII